MKKDSAKTKKELIEELEKLRSSTDEGYTKAQRLETIAEVAGGIAHDFNNQLTGVLGNVSMAKALADPDGKVYPVLEKIEKAALRTRGITRQLLTFSDVGRPVKEPVGIRDLVDESVAVVLRDSAVVCTLELDQDLWPVLADETQLSQVFLNVILNARQAMETDADTKEEIRIEAHNSTLDAGDASGLAPGDYVLITITDAGPGVDAKTLPKIFDPFFTTKKKSSGLGLAVSYSIIRKHNGSLSAETLKGGGLAIRILLPATEQDAQEVRSMKGNRKIVRILVMDDEEVIRDVTGEMLKMLGHEAEFATNGQEAVEMYRSALDADARYDAVILDLSIPGGMGGREVVEKFIEMDPDVKAIVSSGYSRDQIMTEFKEHGFCAAIAKPYMVGEFSKVIKDVLWGTA